MCIGPSRDFVQKAQELFQELRHLPVGVNVSVQPKCALDGQPYNFFMLKLGEHRAHFINELPTGEKVNFLWYFLTVKTSTKLVKKTNVFLKVCSNIPTF